MRILIYTVCEFYCIERLPCCGFILLAGVGPRVGVMKVEANIHPGIAHCACAFNNVLKVLASSAVEVGIDKETQAGSIVTIVGEKGWQVIYLLAVAVPFGLVVVVGLPLREVSTHEASVGQVGCVGIAIVVAIILVAVVARIYRSASYAARYSYGR